MDIRAATEADWPAIWPFWRDIVEAGETYAYPLGADVRPGPGAWWFPTGSRVTVLEEDGSLLGCAKMGPNRPGRGAHVGTATFMVAAAARGRGSVGAWPRTWSPGTARGLGGHPVQRGGRDQHRRGRLWQDLGFPILSDRSAVLRLASGTDGSGCT